MDIFDWLITRLIDGTIKKREDLQRHKIMAAKEFNIPNLSANSEILKAVRERIHDPATLKRITKLLRRKVTRTISGVAPVAVMTSPADCPHGRCKCCPGGVSTNTPQSYTGHEPAALRGATYDFDPYLQTVNRINQLEAIGHTTAKIDLIVMGGTFPARDTDYQEMFIRRCFDGMNKAGTLLQKDFEIRGSGTLEEAQMENEGAAHRCIGLTIETRPDCCYEDHVDRMLLQGCTRVELGVQSIHDRALLSISRGHDVNSIIKATRTLKNRGLKVCYHLMPGLPGETPEGDLEMFAKIFTDQSFRPDMLKIYPVVVVAGTELYNMWKRGEYAPYELGTITELVAEMKALTPRYTRIQRIQRDIPAKMIDDGVKYSNLRQIVRDYMSLNNMKCSCIRCREFGHNAPENIDVDLDRILYKITEYKASGSMEFFIEGTESNSGLLCGYLRLRYLSGNETDLRSEIAGTRTGIIREIKVVGPPLDIGERDDEHIQHLKLGDALLKKAERISNDQGCRQILVTSGVGVRGYYKARGYDPEGPYMRKTLHGA